MDFPRSTPFCAELSINQVPPLCVDWPLAHRLKGTYFGTTRGTSCHSTHKNLLLAPTRTAPSQHENYLPCSCLLIFHLPRTCSGVLLPWCEEKYLYLCLCLYLCNYVNLYGSVSSGVFSHGKRIFNMQGWRAAFIVHT